MLLTLNPFRGNIHYFRNGNKSTTICLTYIYISCCQRWQSEFIFAAPSCLAVTVWFMFSEWSALPSQSHPGSPPSPQCDFLINTFPLAFVCLSLFFLRRFSSRSSLLQVLLLSLLFSHFLLFFFGSEEQRARKRSKTAGERPPLTAKATKFFWNLLKVQRRSKGGRQGPCDNMKEIGGWLPTLSSLCKGQRRLKEARC